MIASASDQVGPSAQLLAGLRAGSTLPAAASSAGVALPLAEVMLEHFQRAGVIGGVAGIQLPTAAPASCSHCPTASAPKRGAARVMQSLGMGCAGCPMQVTIPVR